VDVYGPVCIHWMYMALCVYTVDVYGPVCIHWMYMALCVYTADVWPCVYTLRMYGPGQPYLASTLLKHL